MQKRSLFSWLFFSFVLIFSCGTMDSAVEIPVPATGPDKTVGSYERYFWDALPFDNELVFHGAAGLLSNREESIRLALEDAARKLAIFLTVEGRFYSSTEIGAGFLDYRFDIQSVLNYDREYKNYVSALSFDPGRDVLQRGNAIFIRTRYRAPVPVFIPHVSLYLDEKEKPGWIDNPPLVEGYMVGLGHADRRISPGDTVNLSFEDAVFSIIKNTSALVGGTAADYQGSGVLDFSSNVGSSMIAGAILKGFYVLNIWIDPHTQAVWTLAIAKEAVPY
jgi:hypothetical protein